MSITSQSTSSTHASGETSLPIPCYCNNDAYLETRLLTQRKGSIGARNIEPLPVLRAAPKVNGSLGCWLLGRCLMGCLCRCREQFHISQGTEEYQELLSLVPLEFVGTAARLVPMVKLLCTEMQQSFQETELTCPPWRQADSMISKWVPTKVGTCVQLPAAVHMLYPSEFAGAVLTR